MQGLFASMTDMAIRRLTRNVLGERYVSTAVSRLCTPVFAISGRLYTSRV